MNSVLFYLIILLICNINQTTYALPSTQPAIPLTTTIQSTTIQPASTAQTIQPTTPTTITQPLAGQPATPGAVAAPAIATPLILTYANETQIKAALNECALPNIPMFGTTVADKSKYLIYEAIFKALSSSVLLSQMSFETLFKLLSGFRTDLVDPVLKVTDKIKPIDLTIKNLTDISTLLAQALTIITPINNNLSKLSTPDSSIWKDRFKTLATNLSSQNSAIASKLTLQNDFFKRLEEANSLQSTQLNVKINSFVLLATNYLSKDIINALREDYFNGVSRLMSIMQSGTDEQKNALNKFLDDLLKIKSVFSTTEQDKIRNLKQALSAPAPTVIATTPQVGSAPQPLPTTAIQAPITQPTTPTTIQKTTPTTQIQAQPNYLKETLNTLNTAANDPEKLLDACNNALDTIVKITSLTEKQTLAQKIQEKITFVYDKRASLKPDSLTKLSTLLDKSSKTDLVKAFITTQKINTVKIAVLLNNVYIDEKNFPKFAAGLKTVITSDAFTKEISNYEKTRFSDGVDSLFVNRKTDDVKNAGIDAINSFKSLLDALTIQTFLAKGIFSDFVQRKFLTYSKIISALLILLKPTQAKDLKTQLDYYKPTMDALVLSDTDYEKSLFFENKAQIYERRGNFGYTELTLFKQDLDNMMSKQGLLTIEARTKITTEWTGEIANALSITPSTPDPNTGETIVYLEALINKSMIPTDFNLNVTTVYPKIFSLFTSDTTVRVINVFLIKLNALMTARNQLDKQKLLSFLQIKKLVVDKTGINEIAAMLPNNQKDTLRTWINILKNELQTSSSSK